MMNRTMQKSTPNFFLLSFLLHLLLFLGFGLIITFQSVEEKKKPPQLYVPSYVYKGAITPTVAPKVMQQTKPNKTVDQAQDRAEKSVKLPDKPQSQKTGIATAETKIVRVQPKSILQMSQDFIRQNQMQETIKDHENIEPILMIGDKNTPADPLIRLMGRAISANLIYPKVEEYFDSRAKVLVAFVLHPEGYFSNVQVVKSSDNMNFDNAALYAVNKAPNIPAVRQFLSKPKYFVVGFIFDTGPPPQDY